MEKQILTRMQKQENGSTLEAHISTIDLHMAGLPYSFETIVFSGGHITGNERGERGTESKARLHKKWVNSLREDGYFIVDTQIIGYHPFAA